MKDGGGKGGGVMTHVLSMDTHPGSLSHSAPTGKSAHVFGDGGEGGAGGDPGDTFSNSCTWTPVFEAPPPDASGARAPRTATATRLPTGTIEMFRRMSARTIDASRNTGCTFSSAGFFNSARASFRAPTFDVFSKIIQNGLSTRPSTTSRHDTHVALKSFVYMSIVPAAFGTYAASKSTTTSSMGPAITLASSFSCVTFDEYLDGASLSSVTKKGSSRLSPSSFVASKNTGTTPKTLAPAASMR
jgi:hypothetical protein